MTWSCATCQELWQRRLDEPTPESEAALEQHRLTCPANSGWDGVQRLTDALVRLSPPRSPAGFADQLTRVVLADQRRRRFRVRLRWVVGGALAASLLVTLGLRFLPTGPLPATGVQHAAHVEETTQTTQTQTKPPTDPPVVPNPHEGDVEQPVQATRDVFAAMLDRARKETDDQVTLLRPVVTPPVFDDPGHPGDPAGRPLTDAGQGVVHGLEPVSDSARRAVDLFLRELPPMGTLNETFEP